MLVINPEERISPLAALQHPFLRAADGFRFEMLKSKQNLASTGNLLQGNYSTVTYSQFSLQELNQRQALPRDRIESLRAQSGEKFR